MNSTRLFFIAGMIGAAALSRILPHPPNFAPMNAMALFAGTYLADRKSLAIIVPLLAMWISDAALQVLTGWGFHADMWIIYTVIALITTFGFMLSQRRSVASIVGFSLVASVVFFVLTNFIPWAMHGMYGMYPRTGTGLLACFTAALPFFQNSLLGDMLYAGVLFGGYELAKRTVPSLRAQEMQA